MSFRVLLSSLVPHLLTPAVLRLSKKAIRRVRFVDEALHSAWVEWAEVVVGVREVYFQYANTPYRELSRRTCGRAGCGGVKDKDAGTSEDSSKAEPEVEVGKGVPVCTCGTKDKDAGTGEDFSKVESEVEVSKDARAYVPCGVKDKDAEADEDGLKVESEVEGEDVEQDYVYIQMDADGKVKDAEEMDDHVEADAQGETEVPEESNSSGKMEDAERPGGASGASSKKEVRLKLLYRFSRGWRFLIVL
ncbi:hypothetical protein VNI00_005335 [Paramarasmius palmivorus]|uniref:Uncharacterized protein n=1 Tax=Paramarasmius palmivorus TaxID=297713 RepID=A0AAW0DBL6_9AGAR